jgi:beta-lactamase superfamily II metal-dependent hydrolase
MKKAFLFLCWLTGATGVLGQAPIAGKPLPAWQEGYLDLHHINTGRGNAAYYIFPDGTTMLVDAGELSPLDERTFTPRNAVIRPDSTRKPFEWIAQYIQQVAPVKTKPVIDYALITHFHDDHFGAWYPTAPVSKSGKYLLTGITGVAEKIPVGTLFDRGNPAYQYPYDMKKLAGQHGGGEIRFGQTMKNYFQFLDVQQQRGMKLTPFKAGSRQQVQLLHKANAFPGFYVQNIKANQWIWTGKDSGVVQHFPAIDTANRKTWPDENSLSLALTIHYGPFTYYTGGDNPGNVFTGDNPLRDVETPMAKAIGEVDVATLDHHGNRDAVNEFQVKTFRPRVWIGQSWSSDHPGHEVLIRMTNTAIYSGPRDLFATNMLEANRIVIGPLIDRSYKSQQGHIVVRVLPGGQSYYVVILDDTTPAMPVKAVFGPYLSKTKQ